MTLSVVIVNHNTYIYLIDCLKTLKKSIGNKLKYEVLLVDNASSEVEVKLLKKIKDVYVIWNKKNVGFSVANNQGIKKAKGKYILLLNPDTIINSKSFADIINFYKDNSYAFVGPKLLNSDKTVQPSCGHFFTLPTVFSLLFLKGERLGITKYSPSKSSLVDWLSASCILGKKEYFIKFKFDENIFLYNEEVDLLYRAKKKGLLCYFYNKVSIIHIGAVTTKGKNSVVNIYKGLVYFYKKHYSKPRLTILKLFLIIKYILATTIGIITFNKDLISSYNRAIKVI